MAVCGHCHGPIIDDPAKDRIVGLCHTCSAVHEEIAILGIQMTIADARKILGGKLPAKVRAQLADGVKFYEES